MKALYLGATAPMTFKLRRLMVLIGSTTHIDVKVTRSRSQGPTLTYYMKAIYSGTTAPMTFKLHRLMVLIGSTAHTDLGVKGQGHRALL